MKKRHPKLHRLVLLISLAIMITACQSSTQLESTTDSVLQVTVSILPQAYFVERIGEDSVAVNIMVGPGEEAHTYEPDSAQMKALDNSQVFFSIGVEYEQNWIPRFADINPHLTVVDSAAGIQRIPMTESHSHDDNDEHPEDETREQNLDPHVWLTPENGRIIAANILEALIALAPDQSEFFQENYNTLVTDIDNLDVQISTSLSSLENRQFMVFHPAWGYFAHQYNLEQIPVQIGGQDPSVRELAELVDIARAENIRVIFVQPTFSTADAAALAEEINAEIALVDPLARDWLDNLAAVADAFTAAMSP